MTGSRLRYLDGLRGILAIIVFLHHFFYIFYPDIIFGGNSTEYLKGGWSADKIFAFTPLNLLFNPGAAIHFFFLLSGYVQSYHYYSAGDISLVQKNFVKRYFRLTIPVLTTLLLVYGFHRLGWIRKDLIPVQAITEGFTQTMLPNKLQLPEVLKTALVDVYNKNYSYYQVLWTMPIELMNSWMVLILLFVGHRLKNPGRVVIFWIVVQLFFLQAYYGVAFSIGMLLCRLHLSNAGFNAFLSKPLVRYCCLIAGVYFASYPFVGYEKSTVNSLYGPISFFETYPHIISYLVGDVLLFCFLLHASSLKNILSKAVFRFFGDVSFMLYLLHLLLLFSFSPWFYHALPAAWLFQSKLIATGLTSFLIITALSYVIYRFVDRPGIHCSSVLTKKILGL